MTLRHHVLDFSKSPAVMTSVGRYAPMFHELPHDLAALARNVQGVVSHAASYGVAIPEQRRSRPSAAAGHKTRSVYDRSNI